MATYTLPKIAEMASGQLARGTDVLANDQACQTFLQAQNLNQANIDPAMVPTWTGVHTHAANVVFNTTKQIRLNAAGTSKIHESSTDLVEIEAGGFSGIQIDQQTAEAVIIGAFFDLAITQGQKFYLDTGGVAGDTYWTSPSANIAQLWAGGVLGFYLSAASRPFFPAHTTTASAANAFIDSGTGELVRSTSARRYKTDIKNLDFDSSVVHKLRPVSYKDKKTKKKYFGLIAEEVNKHLPQMVDHNSVTGKCESVFYDRLSVLLLAEIKKLRKEVDALKKVKKVK